MLSCNFTAYEPGRGSLDFSSSNVTMRSVVFWNCSHDYLISCSKASKMFLSTCTLSRNKGVLLKLKDKCTVIIDRSQFKRNKGQIISAASQSEVTLKNSVVTENELNLEDNALFELETVEFLIHNCIVLRNTGSWVDCRLRSHVVVQQTDWRGNNSTGNVITFDGSSFEMRKCIISENAGWTWFYGTTVNMTLKDSSFESNSMGHLIFSEAKGNYLQIVGCRIRNNSFSNPLLLMILQNFSDVMIQSTTFVLNGTAKCSLNGENVDIRIASPNFRTSNKKVDHWYQPTLSHKFVFTSNVTLSNSKATVSSNSTEFESAINGLSLFRWNQKRIRTEETPFASGERP